MTGCGCKECGEKENFGDNGAQTPPVIYVLAFIGGVAFFVIIVKLLIWMWDQLHKQGPILTFLGKTSSFGKKRLH
jgi:hypothetical protein